jgi:hypothetical protein
VQTFRACCIRVTYPGSICGEHEDMAMLGDLGVSVTSMRRLNCDGASGTVGPQPGMFLAGAPATGTANSWFPAGAALFAWQRIVETSKI